ncbi:actin-histidine N-methyltransferase [Nephila pilipes]|uniref:protein-histidine N-methyltransferase n=1 Tax=Nephila pilipes TaxID=299642 RepID=A0A8X6TDW9_NEPPI|nr:actin-histidine N-methyltransferase [Nephila pilipes]
MKKIPKQVKEQLKPLVQKLLTKCSSPKALTKKAEWDEMNEIFEILHSIQELEKDYRISFPDRKNNWERFYEWCEENGAEFSSVEVQEIKEGNFGAVAKVDIKEKEPFLKIPRKIMMSEISAKNSRLGPLISSDPILQHMPNVQVAMHLLTELLDPKSFWLPYISILPSSYSTILYFSMNEIKELQKSPVLDEVFTVIRSVVRQYCYFFQLFQRDTYARSLNIGQYYTYDLYRWAVSSAMTRQNILPYIDGNQQVTSLVPMFDMCNHASGNLSTDFDLKKDLLISYSFKSFCKDEEVCMFYGPRTNAEFMVHNGFVYPENEHDAVEIKLGIGKNDPLSTKKNELCSKLKVSVNGPFFLHKQKLVNDELLKFLEINVMNTEDIEHILNEKQANVDLLSEEFSDLRRKALSFLKDRVNLLMKAYGTTVEEDEDLLKQSIPESIHQYLAVQLRIGEKKILSATYDYCVQNIA